MPTSAIWPRMDEQAPDLSRLIGAPHPAFEAVGRGPGRKVAGREAKERIVALKPCHDDFADLAGRNGFVGPRSHDLDNQVVVDEHAGQESAVGAVGLVGDDSKVRSGVGLARLDGLALEFSAQGRRQRGAGYEGLLQRGDVRACRVRFVEHDLEQVRRTAIDSRP